MINQWNQIREMHESMDRLEGETKGIYKCMSEYAKALKDDIDDVREYADEIIEPSDNERSSWLPDTVEYVKKLEEIFDLVEMKIHNLYCWTLSNDIVNI